MMKYTCYHGTQSNFAKIIIKTKSYEPRGRLKDWLGAGCYFYIEDKQSAFNFCKCVKRIPEGKIVVLETLINVDNAYDLTCKETYARYKASLCKFRKRLSKQKDAKSYPRILDGHFINVLEQYLNFDCIIAMFRDNEKYKTGYSRIINPVLLPETESKKVICVKKVNCIDEDSIKEA